MKPGPDCLGIKDWIREETAQGAESGKRGQRNDSTHNNGGYLATTSALHNTLVVVDILIGKPVGGGVHSSHLRILGFSALTDLAPLHSFALPYRAQTIHHFDSTEQLLRAARAQGIFRTSHLVLGQGSNLVFSCNFDGAIIRLISDKLTHHEDDDYHYLAVDAGFGWHELVCHAMEKGIYGLENLALIPGTVGAAPIQNIGAYGRSFEDFCDYVEFVNKDDLQQQRLYCEQLQFGYRDSIFKHALKDQTLITKVGLRISKHWQPCNGYQGLQQLDTAQSIFEAVCRIRTEKLPDPTKLPNAGSFFKNPQITSQQWQSLSARFNDMPGYPVSSGQYKIPAAWLIERCGFKGYHLGGVGVYDKHALVLVHHGDGHGEQLLALIDNIVTTVCRQFEICLQPEVTVMGKTDPVIWEKG